MFAVGSRVRLGVTLGSEAFYEAAADESADDGVRQGLWMKALAEADGDEAAARILYIKMRESQVEARDTAVRRLQQVMGTREELSSSTPSDLLWAIVSSLVGFAFIALGIVRGDFLWAGVAAAVSGVFWWRYARDVRKTG